MTNLAAKALWKAAKTIRESTVDLNAMLGEIDEIIEEKTLKSLTFHYKNAEDDMSKSEDWITCNYCWVYSVTQKKNPKGRPQKMGVLSLSLQLYSESETDGDWPGKEQAKLFVAVVGRGEDRWELEHLCLDNNGACPDTQTKGRRWFWVEDGKEYENSWFFCIPLDSLKNRASLERIIISPLIGLIEGQEEDEAFKNVEDKELCMPPNS